MTEEPKTLAERSVAWQNRYLTPVLVVLAIFAVGVSWAFGGLEWWFAVPILALGASAMASVIKRNRR